MILRIAEYILKNQEEAREGLGDVMGGKVLELKSDKLIQEGKTVEEVADLLDLTVEYVCEIQDKKF